MMYQLRRMIGLPFNLLQARLAPENYARRIGVNVLGRLKIYGSAYAMFNSEPFLITLGDNVYISVGASFVNHDGGVLPFRRRYPDLDLVAPIVVGNNVFIGMGATILKGVRIGNDCIVGAHAVVTKDVPDGSIVAGNPAKIVKRTDVYLAEGLQKSLGVGHLGPDEKAAYYKQRFGVGAASSDI